MPKPTLRAPAARAGTLPGEAAQFTAAAENPIGNAPETAPSSDPDIEAPAELTLDPASDAAWAALAAQAHRMLDDTLAGMRSLRTQPAWQPMPPTVQAALDQAPAPQAERPLAQVYAEVARNILPHTSANRHPGAWGWVRGQGTPEAMLADMLASAANAHVGGGATAPVHVEQTVIRWLAEALELRAPGAATGPSGLLTSGASMANLLGLAVARHSQAPFPVREQGLSGQPRLLLYASTETHIWATKAVELLGLGRRSLRLIAVGPDSRIDLAALEAQLTQDRAGGEQPFAVIANAGTVNTGAIDNLPRLRTLCDRHNLWMHIDGAFGALLKLAPAHRHLVAGLELADSLAFDLHKWLYLPFETGCLLVRDPALHRAAFAAPTPYLQPTSSGMLAGPLSFSDLGYESSRGFKALRVWMQLSVHGLRKHGALIEQNMAQAAYLDQRIAAHPELEMLGPRPANIVCFRYRPLHASADAPPSPQALDVLNRDLVAAVQHAGRFVVSGTTLGAGLHAGRYAIRVAITNHRSQQRDFEQLTQAVVSVGRALCSSPPAKV